MVSRETVCNVADRLSSELIRNVSDQVPSDVGGQVSLLKQPNRSAVSRVRNVSESGSSMVPDVGGHVSKLSNVAGFTLSNFKSLYGSGCVMA